MARSIASMKREIAQINDSFDAHADFYRDTAADELTADGMKLRLEDVRTMLNPIRENVQAILLDLEEQEADEEEFTLWTDARKNFEIKYFLLTAELQRAYHELARAIPHAEREMHRERVAAVKCPKIELPKFDGSPDKWLRFRDLFESMID
jgi:hypothetical protein